MYDMVYQLLMQHETAAGDGPGLRGAIIVKNDGDDTGAAIIRAYTQLAEGGELLVSFDNKYGYDRLLRGKEGCGALLSPIAVNNMLYRAGFRRQKVYSLYPDAARPLEMFRLGTTVDHRSGATFKERLRSVFTRQPLLRAFHPAYVCVAVKGKQQRRNFFEALMKELDITGPFRIVLGNPATVLLITGRQVIRIPLDRDSRRRCRNHWRALQALAASPAASLTGRAMRKGRFLDREYFVEERLAGTAVDVPLDNMDRLIGKAADFITRFHHHTVRPCRMDERCFRRLIGRGCMRLASCLDGGRHTRLDGLRRQLRERLIGQDIPLVWSHGDFKLENVLFDLRDDRITGIIDWDLSRRAGLPLLDLLYLLVYGTALREGRSMAEVFREKCRSLQFTANEQRLITAYEGALGLSPRLRAPLVTAAWVEHVSCRSREMLEGKSAKCADRAAWLQENVYAVIDSFGELP